MKSDDAILAFSALAQPTRLAVFRLLMTHEPDGLPAGDLARQLEVPHNTMSTHLGILSRAGLIGASRHSRSIVYRARPEAVAALASFLVKDCCHGRPDICAPLIAFVAAFRHLENRITAFAALASLDRVSLQARLTDIGQGEGATSRRPEVA